MWLPFAANRCLTAEASTLRQVRAGWPAKRPGKVSLDFELWPLGGRLLSVIGPSLPDGSRAIRISK